MLFINEWTTTINYSITITGITYTQIFEKRKVLVNTIARYTDTKNLQNMNIRDYFGDVNIGKQIMVIRNCLLSMLTY